MYRDQLIDACLLSTPAVACLLTVLCGCAAAMELKALKAKQHDPAGDAHPYTFTPEITPPQASTTQFTLTCLCPFGCRCAGPGGEKKEVEQTPEQRIRMLTSALREEERRRLQAEYGRKQLEAMAETLRRTGNDQANLIKVRSDVRTG